MIVDTGSTDRTKEIIADTMAGIPGSIEDREWVNLGHNRSEALRLCDGRMDFAIMLDADDSLSGVPERFREVVLSSPGDVDGYRVKVIHGNLQHSRVHVFRMSSQWVYVGAVHDYAECRRPVAKGTANTPFLSEDDLSLEARTEGFRSGDPLKYVKDAVSLEAELVRDPGTHVTCLTSHRATFTPGSPTRRWWRMRSVRPWKVPGRRRGTCRSID